MAHIIAIANQKGGVGKSTTAQALAAGLVLEGNKTLLVDSDQQGNTSYDYHAAADLAGLSEIFTGDATADEVVQNTPRGALIASGVLGGIESRLTGEKAPYALKNALKSISSNYDFVVIDTPPTLGIITINAFVAADSIVVPALPDIYSLQGIGQLHNTVQTVKSSCSAGVRIVGILLTRYTWRSILNRTMHQSMKDAAAAMGTRLFDTTIREGVAIREAQANRESIFDYAPRSKPAQDYRQFVSELLERIG